MKENATDLVAAGAVPRIPLSLRVSASLAGAIPLIPLSLGVSLVCGSSRWNGRLGRAAVLCGNLPILLSQALGVGRLSFGGYEAVVQDVLQLFSHLHVGPASEAHFTIKGQDAPGVGRVHDDVGVEAWRQECTQVGEADGHTATVIGEAQCTGGSTSQWA